MAQIKDMESVYWKRTTKDLMRLRSEKYNRILKLRGAQFMSYLTQQEIRRLDAQIKRIDAILAAREQQQDLF